MKQLKINLTPEFERDLAQYMKMRKLRSKPDAIRQAIREAVSHESGATDNDFRAWLGSGLRAPVRRPRFRNEDDLWSQIRRF
jgi:hypothetical protein